MKIGILCTMTNGFGRRGFYNTQEIGLGHALVKKGHYVTIYKSIKKENGLQAETVEPEPGLTVYYLPTWGIGAHGYLPVKYLEKDMDGLVCFSDNQIFLPHIFRFCKSEGIAFVPYVGIIHSLHKGIRAKFVNTLFRMGTLQLYGKIPVIAKTEAAAQQLKKLGAGDIRVAPVGLDASVLKANFREYDKAALREEYGFARDDVLICSIAQMTETKRPLALVDIFSHIVEKKKFRMIMVGAGPLRETVKKKIADFGLADKIELIERIPYENIWKIYAMSDYFVNLNQNEIFGMAIMEAVYYETSVAAFQTAPGSSMILKGMSGHCLCKNDEQVEAWLTAPYPAKEELVESARKAIQKFSWDRSAEIFLEIIERKMGNMA